MRLRRGILPALAGLLGTVPALAHAQAPSPAQIFKTFQPTQKGVDYDTPEGEAVAACKVEQVKAADGKVIGWAVKDGQGKLLRRFIDSALARGVEGKSQLDQWSYFKDGFEVYREVDLDRDGSLDECRWLNAGGTRVATIKGGKIVGWRRLSAEEASKVFVQALVSGDGSLLASVMATPEELTALGVPAAEVQKAADAAARRVKELEALQKGLKNWNSQTTWSRFDGILPHVIPADVTGKDDLLLYENAVIFATPAGSGDPLAMAYLQAPEMVRVGDAWKFVQLPRPIDPQNPQASAVAFDGGIRAALYGNLGGAGGPAGPSGPVAEIIAQLAELDAAAPDPADDKAVAEYHLKRVNLLRKAIQVGTPEEQLSFSKQAIDSLAEAYRTGQYPGAAEVLDKYIAKKDKLGSYAEHRKILAEYALEARDAGANFLAVQKALMEKLAAFVEKHPKSDEAPDALLQLAFINESLAEEDKAREAYQRLATEYADTAAGKKGAGALRRLDLVGQPLDLEGTDAAGKPVKAADFRGKTLLVLFWTSSSDLFNQDLPELVKLYEENKAKGFEILGVNLDLDPAAVEAFRQQNPTMTWPQIHEEGGMEGRLADQFGILSTPTLFLVDASGKVVNRTLRTSAEVRKALEQALANPVATANAR